MDKILTHFNSIISSQYVHGAAAAITFIMFIFFIMGLCQRRKSRIWYQKRSHTLYRASGLEGFNTEYKFEDVSGNSIAFSAFFIENKTDKVIMQEDFIEELRIDCKNSDPLVYNVIQFSGEGHRDNNLIKDAAGYIIPALRIDPSEWAGFGIFHSGEEKFKLSGKTRQEKLLTEIGATGCLLSITFFGMVLVAFIFYLDVYVGGPAISSSKKLINFISFLVFLVFFMSYMNIL